MPPISLASNIASLTAQRRLADVSNLFSRSLERLSSGQRINRASDDSAGLAISSTLLAHRRVYSQGIRNLNDGLSLLNIADGAIEQLSQIVIRLKELAEQAANGTYGTQQRKALDTEAQALSREFFRIERGTSFNGRGLFFAEFVELRVQGGFGESGGIQSGLGGAIGTGTFHGNLDYTGSTGSANDIASGDLNGDGYADLVTATSASGDGYVNIRISSANGGFSSTVSYLMHDASSHAVALGDVNNDGFLDIVATGTGTRDTAVILGNGDGTFGSVRTYQGTADTGESIALGDLNSDGNLDMVVGGFGGVVGSAAVMLGNGDGTFGASSTFNTEAGGTYGIALADLNGDRLLDLVTAGTSVNGRAVVRMGNGNGTFAGPVTYTMESTITWALEVVDVDSNGVLDLVTAGVGGAQGRVTVRLGSSDGTFGVATSFLTGDTTVDLSVGDVNGDGFLDAVTTGSFPSRVSLLLGSGSGTFGAAATLALNSGSSYSVTVADLNGDGVLDIAAGGESTGTQEMVTVRLASTAAGISPLLPFKLTTRADALQALPQFDLALNRLASQRGTIGAFQARLSVADRVLQATADNYAAAAGRILDADVAAESADLIRNGILQQAASAILGQANQQPAIALRLLEQN